MDGYAEMMLHDDVSSKEEIEIVCPRCQYKTYIKASDQHVKCLKCGEIFYIEEMEESF